MRGKARAFSRQTKINSGEYPMVHIQDRIEDRGNIELKIGETRNVENRIRAHASFGARRCDENRVAVNAHRRRPSLRVRNQDKQQFLIRGITDVEFLYFVKSLSLLQQASRSRVGVGLCAKAGKLRYRPFGCRRNGSFPQRRLTG